MDKIKEKVAVEKDGKIYRIRKIVPIEAFRLMDFSDEQFKRAEQVASNTALFKVAGNSIVCNCLVAILGQMIEGRENYYRNVDNVGENVDKIKD